MALCDRWWTGGCHLSGCLAVLRTAAQPERTCAPQAPLLAMLGPGLQRAPSSRPASPARGFRNASRALLELLSGFCCSSPPEPVDLHPPSNLAASNMPSHLITTPINFHVMSPFNPRPRFVRFSPCLPYSYGYYCHNHQTLSPALCASYILTHRSRRYCRDTSTRYLGYAHHVPATMYYVECRPG